MIEFTECLNDTWDYFFLTDPRTLSEFQSREKLGSDLLNAFTTSDAAERAVENGVMIPMGGIANFPYTILFNLDDEPSPFAPGDVQLRDSGHILQVQGDSLSLVTAPYLRDWPASRELPAFTEIRPSLSMEPGWYTVAITGGEVVRHSGHEPAFEFAVRRSTERPTYTADMNFRFILTSREY